MNPNLANNPKPNIDMKIRIFTLIALSFTSLFPLGAATDSHIAAANDLSAVISPQETFKKAFMSTFEISLEQMAQGGVPEDKVTKIREAALELAKTVAEDPEMSSRIASIYVDTYTEAEIKELLIFYNTPVGKKTIATIPEVSQKSATIGQELTEKHMANFQSKMMTILSAE